MNLPESERRTRVLLASIVPPRNDNGVRIVMHRHLVERHPFELHVASNADFADDLLIHTVLRLPYLLHRLRKSRFGPRLAPWFRDYENCVWTQMHNREFEKTIKKFKPQVVLTLAETSLCHIAARAAKRHGIPLAGLFLDWFPVMKGHFGSAWTRDWLSRRYRRLYNQCDLAFCTSEGMQEFLGPHPNSHVIYPMPGKHAVPETIFPPKSNKFRLAYVGAAENFYGGMLRSLLQKAKDQSDLEIIIVGPTGDWPKGILEEATKAGVCLGFKPPDEAAKVLAGADALLVVMSFEEEHKLYMQTSFTTKMLDYSAFSKPIILWGPDYCAPLRVVKRTGGALVVNSPDAGQVLDACRIIGRDAKMRKDLSLKSHELSQTIFNPDRLQGIFVGQIEKLVNNDRN